MNRYESVILDKMVDIRQGDYDGNHEDGVRAVLLLLDCICDFREPPRALDVEDGYGALAVVNMDGEVVE